MRRQNEECRCVCDNGSEFASKAMDQWSYRNGIELKIIQTGKPTQNAFIESFNARLRAECLSQNSFEDLNQIRSMIEAWRIEYTTERPNKALGRKTLDAFAKEQERLPYGKPFKPGGCESSNGRANVRYVAYCIYSKLKWCVKLSQNGSPQQGCSA